MQIDRFSTESTSPIIPRIPRPASCAVNRFSVLLHPFSCSDYVFRFLRCYFSVGHGTDTQEIITIPAYRIQELRHDFLPWLQSITCPRPFPAHRHAGFPCPIPLHKTHSAFGSIKVSGYTSPVVNQNMRLTLSHFFFQLQGFPHRFCKHASEPAGIPPEDINFAVFFH